jgi:hypothetical protein
MLFSVIYRRRPATDEAEARRLLRLFVAWAPPPELEIRSHYAFVDGGGVAIVETDNPAILKEALAPFVARLDFQIEPTMHIAEAVAIAIEANEWSDSIT